MRAPIYHPALHQARDCRLSRGRKLFRCRCHCARNSHETRRQMTWVIVLAAVASLTGVYQATLACKNCIAMGKEEKAMFRAHSDMCMPQSQVDPKLIDSLLNGELVEDPVLKKHIYCVLLRCKIISKDGKLQKAAVLGKMSSRSDARNATKVLESCADQTGETPEDLAWNLFRCGYNRKALLFNYMPTTDTRSDLENNSN